MIALGPARLAVAAEVCPARLWLLVTAVFSGTHHMMPFQASTLTVFALLITTPKSLLPSAATMGLSVICAVAVVLRPRTRRSHNCCGKIPALIALLCVTMSSCGVTSKTLDFSRFKNADRISVRTNSDTPVKELTDPRQVAAALDFLDHHATGWSENWSGPLIPALMLQFYEGEKRLGGFGIGRTYIVADPSTHGWLSRRVTIDDGNALLNTLTLRLP